MELPFDAGKLDALMDQAHVDLVLATSKHNVRYLLGGYQFFFFANGDAIGLGRYLPVVGYPKGHEERSFYVGAGNEDWGHEVHPLWVQQIENSSWSSQDSAQAAVRFIKRLGLERATIAVEHSFLPADAMGALRDALPGARFVEAITILEELRAVKSSRELALIKDVAAAIVAAMLAAIHSAEPGITERELVERVRREQTNRGLAFDYCLITTGRTFGRAPSSRCWEEGDIVSLDSAGYNGGYLGDMARMGVMGAPTMQMHDLLAEIAAVQAAARAPIAAGRAGDEIYATALDQLARCPHRAQMTFLAHGMGLIPHEAPRLTDTGSIPYPASYKDRALAAGMVLSIETHMRNPDVGFVKLEDTVVVTDTGWDAFGDAGRGWNIAGR